MKQNNTGRAVAGAVMKNPKAARNTAIVVIALLMMLLPAPVRPRNRLWDPLDGSA